MFAKSLTPLESKIYVFSCPKRQKEDLIHIDLILVDHCQVFFSDQFIDLLPETIFHPASRDNTFRARPWLNENLVNSLNREWSQEGEPGANLSQARDALHAVATFSLLATSGLSDLQKAKEKNAGTQFNYFIIFATKKVQIFGCVKVKFPKL